MIMKRFLTTHVLILIVFYGSSQSCDLERKYVNNGECCKKCPPGTRMVNLDNCFNPTCEPCKDSEYQDQYTNELKCKRHPYCDGNVHLESTKPITKDKISVCACMNGYHCDSSSCVICIQNRQCPPGQFISEPATQHTDNVCQVCPSGSFSDTNSSQSCQPWKECAALEVEGTTTTDRVCGHVANHTGAIVAVILVLVVAVVGFAVHFVCKEKCEELLGRKIHGCFTPLKDVEKGVTQEEQAPVMKQQAEENDANEHTQEGDGGSDSIDDGRRTENGKVLRQAEQECGKEHTMSQPETSFYR